MALQRLKWLTAALVILFLLSFDYLRHFVFVSVLHSWPIYSLSVLGVVGLILAFNHVVFSALDRMQQSVHRQNQRLATLNGLAATLSESLDLQATLRGALEQVRSGAGVDAACIQLINPGDLVISAPPELASRLAEAMRAHPDTAHTDTLGGTPEDALARMIDQWDQLARSGICPGLSCLPLRSKGNPVGVLVLGAPQRRRLDSADQDLLHAIGTQIGIAIENATLHSQVQQQASHLNTLIESSGNAIITIDTSGQIRSWNHAAELIYGWQKSEAIGRVLPMVPAPLLPEATALMTRVVQTGATVANVETQRLCKNGEIIPVLVTISPVCDVAGAVNGILGVSTDLRDRKRLEKDLLRQQRDLAALEERERLARVLHDDLGQVLAYVNMQAQAAHALLNAGQGQAAATHLTRLTEVVQEAHSDVRQYILRLKSSSLPDQSFVATLEDYLQRANRHDDFQTELIAGDLSGVTFRPGAETQLIGIVQEAITNARKHARARHVRIHCAASDGQVRVTITDDGCGFDRAAVEHEPGRHFGLRIMRDRAEEAGGCLQIQSRPGAGTLVQVTIPGITGAGNDHEYSAG